jgi:sterol desaturase/sphingolipid hydroxylase (fatty acid hydroxylase superfamily)
MDLLDRRLQVPAAEVLANEFAEASGDLYLSALMQIALILFGTFYWIMGDYVFIFMPGFMTGYLLNVYVHVSIHKTPVPSFLKMQYRHHSIHHYRQPDRAFGLTSPLWDWVFGTMPDEKREGD